MESLQDALTQIVQDSSVLNKDSKKGFSWETTFFKHLCTITVFHLLFYWSEIPQIKNGEQTPVQGAAINLILILTKQMSVPSFASSAVSKNPS